MRAVCVRCACGVCACGMQYDELMPAFQAKHNKTRTDMASVVSELSINFHLFLFD